MAINWAENKPIGNEESPTSPDRLRVLLGKALLEDEIEDEMEEVKQYLANFHLS